MWRAESEACYQRWTDRWQKSRNESERWQGKVGKRRTKKRTKGKVSEPRWRVWTLQGQLMWCNTSERNSLCCPSVISPSLHPPWHCHALMPSFGTRTHIFQTWWEPFIKGRGLSYAATLPCNHLRGIPITSGLIDVRFIKVNEPTGHLLSSRRSTGDGGRRGQKTHDKKAARADLNHKGGGVEGGEKSWEERQRDSLPTPFLPPSIPPCNQRQALTSLRVFSTLPYVLHPFYDVHISTIWLHIWRVYIWHMINGPQPALYVQ